MGGNNLNVRWLFSSVRVIYKRCAMVKRTQIVEAFISSVWYKFRIEKHVVMIAYRRCALSLIIESQKSPKVYSDYPIHSNDKTSPNMCALVVQQSECIYGIQTSNRRETSIENWPDLPGRTFLWRWCSCWWWRRRRGRPGRQPRQREEASQCRNLERAM